MFRIVQQASSISFRFGEGCLDFDGENLSDLAYIMGLRPKKKKRTNPTPRSTYDLSHWILVVMEEQNLWNVNQQLA